MKSKHKLYTITKSGLHYLPQNYLITYSWNLLSREAINLENEKERIYRNVAFVCTAYSCFISVSIQSLIYFAAKGIRRRVIFSFAFCNRFENVSTYTNDPYIKYVIDMYIKRINSHLSLHIIGLKTIINALLNAVKQLAEVMTLTIFCLMVFALFALQVSPDNMEIRIS